ncbi:unnamed protein product [Amaranthus hypochondriacus]
MYILGSCQFGFRYSIVYEQYKLEVMTEQVVSFSSLKSVKSSVHVRVQLAPELSIATFRDHWESILFSPY